MTEAKIESLGPSLQHEDAGVFLRRGAPIVVLGAALGAVFSDRPFLCGAMAAAIMLMRKVILAKPRSLLFRACGAVGAACGLAVFIHYAGLHPTSFLIALAPAIGFGFLLPPRYSPPAIGVLALAVTLTLALSGGDTRLVVSAAFVVLGAGMLVRPAALAMAERSQKLGEVARELDAERAFQDLVLQTNPNLIFVKNERLEVVAANRAFLDLYPEAMREKVLGRDRIAPRYEAQAAAFLETDLRALETGYAESDETIRMPDGSERTFMTKKLRFERSDGSRHILCTGADITEERRAAKALQVLTDRFERALEGMEDGLWDFDLVSGEAYIAPQCVRLLGYTDEEAAPYTASVRAWLSLVHPDDEPRIDAALRAHLERNEPYDVQLRFRRPDGSYQHFRSRGKAYRNEAGQPVRMAGAIQDISRQKAQEAALEEARESAMAAAAAKSQFLANMSHEIRTPLNGVLGMLQLLADSELSEHQRRHIDLASSSAGSLIGVIDDILDFSKIDAGKLPIESVPFDIRKLFGELCEAQGDAAQRKGLDIVLDLTGVAVREVVGDPVRIRQVANNLISNAIKFTSFGEVALTATVEERDGVFWLQGSVRDTGIGIPADKLSQLFAAFAQADSSTTRLYGGTGLGLAISKRLCQLMDGDIRVSSTPGQGAEFHFEMRLAGASGDCWPWPCDQVPTVWLKDGHPGRRESARRQLEAWGVRPLVLGASAEFPDTTRFPELLIFAPDEVGDGLDELEALRSRGFDGKIAVLTTLAGALRAEAWKARGIDLMLPAPLTDDDYDAMARALGRGTRKVVERPAESTALAGLEILLVEDNAVNQTVAVRLLTRQGASVEVAEDGLIALDALRERSFDLVLMDCQMPRMDGFAATRAIRSGEAGAERAVIPIVALTANALPDDRRRCEEAGMDGYVTKPFRIADLGRAIAGLF